mgnify:FL=1
MENRSQSYGDAIGANVTASKVLCAATCMVTEECVGIVFTMPSNDCLLIRLEDFTVKYEKHGSVIYKKRSDE